jgi:hypothetical protein
VPPKKVAVPAKKTAAVRRLIVFISYASEDNQLAIALYRLLDSHLGQDFAKVLIDTQSFRHGFELNDLIQQQLRRTDILIVVYTGQQKPSHGFTGIEIGFFLGLPKIAEPDVRRRIIPFYRQSPPEATAGLLGVRFDIDKGTLKLSEEEYRKSLLSVTDKHVIVSFLEDLENEVNAIRKAQGFGADPNFTVERRLENTRIFLAAIFNELKKTIDDVNAPQKKLVINVSQGFGIEDFELPGNAVLQPEGIGTMAIFGLPEGDTSWEDFLHNTNPKYRNAWKDAIETVVTSSLGESDVDNSQTIVATNGKQLYRLMLSRSILFYDNRRQFHLYFLEISRRHDFGDRDSTRLLKALALCCRFRFMFFEKESEFSEEALSLRDPSEMKEWARKLVKELNLMKRDALESELENTGAWRFFIEPARLLKMNNDYKPIEAKIYDAAQKILDSNESTLVGAKDDLVNAIHELDANFRERNAQLIRDLGGEVSRLPDNAQSSTSALSTLPISREMLNQNTN